MKIIAMFAAGALATGTLFAAAPADAQRYGWDGRRGWNGPRRGYGGYRGGYRDSGYGYRGPRGYGRSRVVCRIERGYYGPVRRCFRR
jgi:hypothetical protein